MLLFPLSLTLIVIFCTSPWPLLASSGGFNHNTSEMWITRTICWHFPMNDVGLSSAGAYYATKRNADSFRARRSSLSVSLLYYILTDFITDYIAHLSPPLSCGVLITTMELLPRTEPNRIRLGGTTLLTTMHSDACIWFQYFLTKCSLLINGI